MNNKRNILICPLEWGLGHAGRMILLAKRLQELNNNVIIGSGEEHSSLFRNELSGLTFVNFPGFKPGYSRILPQYIALLLKTPVLFYHIIKEHFQLKNIVSGYNIDIVISDNRFGLWNKKVKTVYVTHLPVIPLPEKLRAFEWIGIHFHRFIIKKYSFCFVPDLPGDINLSGRLSHGVKLPQNVRFTGIMSRFSDTYNPSHNNTYNFPHNTLILSGPEPQRGILRQKISDLLKDKDQVLVILEGKPGAVPEINKSGNILSFNHLASSDMREMISGSDCIISRSGYSTIMELISLDCSAFLIPTPGQTEQEYLARYLAGKGWFSFTEQKNLKPELSLPVKTRVTAGELIKESKVLLEKALEELLKD